MVKKRDERHRVIEVFKRSVYGDIPLETISTVYLERHNLTLRHENRRLTRKTVAFSKKDEGLKDQMTIYQSYFNFVRSHHGLKLLFQITIIDYESGSPEHLLLLQI